MTFKTKTIERGFHKLDYRVRLILIALDVRRTFWRLPEVVVTSTIRKDGVHATTRAADVGVNGMEKLERKAEARWLNWHFPRKGKYKTALLHDVGRGMHVHIQVAGTKDTIYQMWGHLIVLERV